MAKGTILFCEVCFTLFLSAFGVEFDNEDYEFGEWSNHYGREKAAATKEASLALVLDDNFYHLNYHFARLNL